MECVHCGRMMGDYAGGWGSVAVDGKSVPLCHPNAPNRPDCYHLVTVYHEIIGMRRTGQTFAEMHALVGRHVIVLLNEVEPRGFAIGHLESLSEDGEGVLRINTEESRYCWPILAVIPVEPTTSSPRPDT